MPNLTIETQLKIFKDNWEIHFKGSDIQYADDIVIEWLSQALESVKRETLEEVEKKLLLEKTKCSNHTPNYCRNCRHTSKAIKLVRNIFAQLKESKCPVCNTLGLGGVTHFHVEEESK